MDSRKEKLIDQHLVVFILSLGLPLVLYFNRQLDDNRLTSWNWVFHDVGSLKFLVLLGISLLVAFGVTRIRLQWRPFSLFLVSFLATVFFWSIPEVMVDAARYFSQAKQLKIQGIDYFFSEWGNNIFAWTDLPLTPMLYGLVFRFFGENRLWLQVLNSLFFSGTVLLTYRLGKTLWEEALGMYAGFLLLGFPYIFTQAPLMLVDIQSMFFLLLAVYSYTCYLKHGGGMRFVTTSCAVLLALLVKYSAWLYLSVLVVVFAVFIINSPKRVILRTALVLGIVLPVAGGLYLFFHDVVNSQMGLLASYQKSGLHRWGESFVSTFLFQTHPLLTLTALLSIGVALFKRDVKYLIISYLVIILILLQIKRSRYIVPVFPMLALMSSYGIMHLRFPETRKLLVACIVSTSLFVSIGGYLPFLNRMSAKNLQNAGKYLDEQKVKSAWTAVLPQQKNILNPDISLPLLDIYTKAVLMRVPTREAGAADRGKIATSSLRFTWEFPLPGYYTRNEAELRPEGLVVVGSMPDQKLPYGIAFLAKKFKHRKVFNTSTGRFIHNTVVTVYH
jgi:hypothetical protein